MELDELRKLQKQVQGAAQEFKTSVESAAQDVHAGVRSVEEAAELRGGGRRRSGRLARTPPPDLASRANEPGAAHVANAANAAPGDGAAPIGTARFRQDLIAKWPNPIPLPKPACRRRSCRTWSSCARRLMHSIIAVPGRLRRAVSVGEGNLRAAGQADAARAARWGADDRHRRHRHVPGSAQGDVDGGVPDTRCRTCCGRRGPS